MFLLLDNLANNDKIIFNIINHQIANPFFDKLMPLLSFLGNSGGVWIFFAVLAYLLGGPKGRKLAVLVFITVILSDLMTEVLIKHLVARPRPFLVLPGVRVLVTKPTSFSFPSGHSAVSFAAGLVIAKNFPKYTWLLFLLAFGIAFSRVYVGVHFPSDVLAGALIGGALAYLILLNQQRIEAFVDRAREKYFRRTH